MTRTSDTPFPEIEKPRRKWLRRLAWFGGFVGLMTLWATQPHLGANVCLIKGFMWESDFVEELRPNLRQMVASYVLAAREEGEVPPDMTTERFVSAADKMLDLLKRCADERGVKYCRYAGPDENGSMMEGRTVDGPNAIAPEDKYKYRYIVKSSESEIVIVPRDVDDSRFELRIYIDDKEHKFSSSVCQLGCLCNPRFK